jgi:hypothetical protein
MTIPDLSSAHRTTYETIFRQPMAHNLHWRDVHSLLGALGEVMEQPNGNVKVTRNGQSLILHEVIGKDVGTDAQLKELRAFLERSGDAAVAPVASGTNLLVVIDHRQARIYKSEFRGSIPERIEPYDPDGTGRHLHYVENDSNGQRRPERKTYYEAIAKALHGAQATLLFGSGTGASSAMEQLLAELTLHHKDLAARIVGSLVVDEHHLSEDQLLAKAREFYANIAPQPRATTPA